MHITPIEIITFWFGTNPTAPLQNKKKWFTSSPAFDQEIKTKFGTTLTQAKNGELDHWLDSPDGTLAFILLLDQFSRNIYRNTPQVFAQDDLALSSARDAIKHGMHTQLAPHQRAFIYIPFMHAEDLKSQDECILLFEELIEKTDDATLKQSFKGNLHYAHQHRDIIKKFGRYPHRNIILNRTNTPDEIEFLKQPNSSF